MSDTTVILIGATTRAAAASARRAGWMPWCADLFADADLERMAAVRRVPMNAYPNGLLDALRDAPDGPVIYTGALENRPDLIEKLDRSIWGNPPSVLRSVRSVESWTSCLRDRALPCPRIAHDRVRGGRWLLKPRKSAGGFGIQAYRDQPFQPRTRYLQEWIDGVPCAAIFLGLGTDVAFLGATEQLIGVPWLNASGFHYAGSVGPMIMSAATLLRWRDLGATLARAFGLRGLFGIDAILRDGVPWPVEINPRYTASVEILERGLRLPLMQWHRDAFERQSLTNLDALPPPIFWAKGILFARATLVFPDVGPWLECLEPGVDLDEAAYADIPHGGAIIERGQPVLTLFASAATAKQCRAALQEKARALDRRLWG